MWFECKFLGTIYIIDNAIEYYDLNLYDDVLLCFYVFYVSYSAVMLKFDVM